jgi:hypothetical protein
MLACQQRSGASGLSHARALDAADVGATEVAVDTSRALSLKLYWCCTLLNLGALLRAALQVLRAAVTCCFGCCFGFPGPQKKKNGCPPWWVGGAEAKKGLGSDLFFSIFFYRVFELPLPRNAQKRDKKKIEKKSVLDFWSNVL